LVSPLGSGLQLQLRGRLPAGLQKAFPSDYTSAVNDLDYNEDSICDMIIIPCSNYARKTSTKSIVDVLTLEEVFVVALFVLPWVIVRRM
jgi:hypothetical protein